MIALTVVAATFVQPLKTHPLVRGVALLFLTASALGVIEPRSSLRTRKRNADMANLI